MRGSAVGSLRFVCALLGVVGTGFFAVYAAKPAPQGLPTDWTHHHVIFSQPGTSEQVQRVAQDPRYWQQWYRENVVRTLAFPADDDSSPSLEFARSTTKSSGLWSEDMGNNATAGAGNYPAKYSFSVTSASCSDFVVFSTGLAGSTTQASIVAYDNLYIGGCTGNVPSTYWAYNTGGQILTSPSTSTDGTQIAFVQTNAGSASLVLLKWAASNGTVGSPATNLTTVAASSYRACTAPCMTTLPLQDSLGADVNDTLSSVFPDYTHDVIYVGGASSWLFKFTGVFRGTPTEVTAGFPVQLNASLAAALTSPIYDFESGNIFVADSEYLYLVSKTGTVTPSARLDYGAGMVSAPVVDSSNGFVYAFSTNDNGTGCTAAPCAGIYAFSITGFPGTPTEAEVGTASIAGGNAVYEAAFDHAYYASSNGTGNVYICGAPGSVATLYKVPVAAGTFSAVEAVTTLTTAGNDEPCSPVSDIYNPNTASGPEEWVFFGVKSKGRSPDCTTGCAVNFVSLPWAASTSYSVGQEVLIRRTANDTNYVNVAITGGKTGTATPTWPSVVGRQTTDGTVIWMNQGASSVAALAAWAASNTYAAPSRIVDSNGNVEITTGGGTSGTAAPTWALTAGAATTDNTVTWINAGPYASSAQPSDGGVSGIILDNVVASGTKAGASQVYFSTLGNQTCATSGGKGGCAIQASQSALK